MPFIFGIFGGTNGVDQTLQGQAPLLEFLCRLCACLQAVAAGGCPVDFLREGDDDNQGGQSLLAAELSRA